MIQHNEIKGFILGHVHMLTTSVLWPRRCGAFTLAQIETVGILLANCRLLIDLLSAKSADIRNGKTSDKDRKTIFPTLIMNSNFTYY